MWIKINDIDLVQRKWLDETENNSKWKELQPCTPQISN